MPSKHQRRGGLAMGAAVQLQSAVERFVGAPVRKMLIDGKWVEAASGKKFETVNPATGQVLARVAEGDKEDIDRAVRAARRAFDDGKWARMNPTERQRLLPRTADLIEAIGDELAQLETLDNGKPFMESRHVDIPASAETFRYYAGWVNKIYGETNPSDAAFFNFTLREPVGVCGQIIPWNFPLLMCAWKLAPALACGNTSVLKPAEQTPLTALRLGELLLEAGVPAGVVNIVPGFGPTAGGALVRHPMVDKIAFTGSTEVGKEIHRETASTLKRVSLELGGKSPNIVFSDADPEAAVQGALLGVFFCAGQVCCAGTRLFVEQKMHDEFADKLAKTAAEMKQGPGLDPETRIGPLVSQEQLERVTGYLEVGKKEGAKALIGGERNTGKGLEKGYFVKPTIFTGVRNDMKIAREESFGPGVSVIPFKDENDAVLQGNDTTYGRAAGATGPSSPRAGRWCGGSSAGRASARARCWPPRRRRRTCATCSPTGSPSTWRPRRRSSAWSASTSTAAAWRSGSAAPSSGSTACSTRACSSCSSASRTPTTSAAPSATPWPSARVAWFSRPGAPTPSTGRRSASRWAGRWSCRSRTRNRGPRRWCVCGDTGSRSSRSPRTAGPASASSARASP